MLEFDRAEARHAEVLHMVDIAERNFPTHFMTILLGDAQDPCVDCVAFDVWARHWRGEPTPDASDNGARRIRRICIASPTLLR